MTLEELARSQPFALPLAVPEWTLGCFERRCITYATGQEDTTTRVIWLQSHGLTGDIRIPAGRPSVQGRSSLADCSADDLAALAVGEGFAAQTAWADGHMSWDAFASFQAYDKWPEPGRLERVGACLIEWAPSGAYVEDWRLQPGSSGLSVGLRLIGETGADGIERPREGALVIAGDHALQVIDRREPLAPGRAQASAATSPAQVFDCDIAYARRALDEYRVEAAVNPFRQGQALFEDTFTRGAAADELLQTGLGEWRARRWRVDTLLAEQSRDAVTPASASALAWLKGEGDVLGLTPCNAD